ncbi:MAG: HAMP domain-containing histidine kinase [Acidobacteria bacterium]|nr:HAMP domain-containing histidine kinase [Acidobacteriota bacterium]
MSLRIRLYVLFATLLAALVAAEWWLVRSLTKDLESELGKVASRVGEDVLGVVGLLRHKMPAPDASGLPPAQGFSFQMRTAEGSKEPATASGTSVWTTGPDGAPPRVIHEETVVEGPNGEGKRMVRSLRVESSGTFRIDPSGKIEHLPPAEGGTAAGSPPGAIKMRSPGLPERVLVLSGPNFQRVIPLEEAGVEKALERFKRQLLLGSLLVLGVGFLVAAFVADRVASPLSALALTARRVAEQGPGETLQVRASGEAREAIDAFNRMSTRLRELEAEALALKERQHLGELGEVARGLAHALRNPLHALGLSVNELAERAERSGDGAGSDELVQSATRQIRHIDGSIRSFLALASGGGGAEEELSVQSLASEVALTALQDARGRVRVSVAEGEPATLRGIGAEVKAVLQALVVNAIEASPDGETVHLQVETTPEGAVRVLIEDRGPGLPEEVRARLFAPHVTTKVLGSGMGLYLAHRIAVTRYGGSLELQETLSGGTRAVLVLRSREEAPRA